MLLEQQFVDILLWQQNKVNICTASLMIQTWSKNTFFYGHNFYKAWNLSSEILLHCNKGIWTASCNSLASSTNVLHKAAAAVPIQFKCQQEHVRLYGHWSEYWYAMDEKPAIKNSINIEIPCFKAPQNLSIFKRHQGNTYLMIYIG